MKTILITGSAGFIGSHLAEYYLKKNDQVIGIDNYITGSRENIIFLKNKFQENFHFFELDVCEKWPPFFKNYPVDFVFHLASAAAVNQYQEFALQTMWANSIGLKNAIDFSDQSNARLIFSSTSEVYGSAEISPQPEDYWGKVNPFGERSCYDESKRFGEALIYTSNKKNKTKHGLVRIFNTYGPRMNSNDGRVIIRFIRQALKNENLTIYGNGQQTRSFCYISDLIQGLARYAESHLTEPINLGHSEEVSIIKLAQTILSITKSSSEIKLSELPDDDPPQRKPDLVLAKKYLDFNPKTNLSEGLKLLIDSKKPDETFI